MITRLLEYRHSLRFKITAALLLVLTVSISSAIFGIWTYERDEFIKMADVTAHLVGRAVAKHLRTAMLENDRPAVQATVEEISAIYEPPMRISIVNPGGLVAVSSDPLLIGKTIDRFSSPSCAGCHPRPGVQSEKESMLIEGDHGQLLRHVFKIPNEPECNQCHPESTKTLGIIIFDADLSRTAEILRTIFVRMLLTGLVTFLAIGLVLFLAIERYIHRPTTKLMEGFIQVGHGNFNSWVEEDSSSEFSYMADQFNVMSRAIGRFINEINEKNKESSILYAIVREVSETIEWERLKSIIVNLVHDIYRTGQSGLLLPHRHKHDCFDIVWRNLDEERLGHLVHCLGNSDLSIAAISSEELAEWHREKYSTHRFLDNYERLIIPLIYRNESLGLICVKKLSIQRFSPHERAIAPALAKHAAISLANARLYHQAITDGLTNLYSKRHLFSKIEIQIARQKKYAAESFIILMMDLDHFKEVNDNFGHEAGDQVLIQLAELFRQNIRLGDIPFRYGGEEFVIMVPAAPGQTTLGQEIAERLRSAVERHVFDCPDCPSIRKTISIGVACFPIHGGTAHEIIRAADQAMYRAKTTGRNKVCAAEHPAA